MDAELKRSSGQWCVLGEHHAPGTKLRIAFVFLVVGLGVQLCQRVAGCLLETSLKRPSKMLRLMQWPSEQEAQHEDCERPLNNKSAWSKHCSNDNLLSLAGEAELPLVSARDNKSCLGASGYLSAILRGRCHACP